MCIGSLRDTSGCLGLKDDIVLLQEARKFRLGFIKTIESFGHNVIHLPLLQLIHRARRRLESFTFLQTLTILYIYLTP